jgi:MoaA/NifB/PqqE/SkfB family radical SAM enzyme
MVYNIGVPPNKNYFVEGVLVHNCYASAITNGENYKNLREKIYQFFGPLSPNQRPYQVTIGGGGEPTLHPEFVDALKAFTELGIVPNYTTNAMHVSPKIIEATLQYCGGVAVTLHPHLERYWRKGIQKFAEAGIRLNSHVIISDRESIETAAKLYDEYAREVEYFVLLPYRNVGFAAKNPKQIDYKFLEGWLNKVYSQGRLAFGAYFYDWLRETGKFDVALYPPEIMSKYLVLEDELKIYNNSFDCKPVEGFWSRKAA